MTTISNNHKIIKSKDGYMRKLGLSLCLLCVFLSSCTSNTNSVRKSEAQEYKFDGFSLRYPKNITIKKKTPVEDFDLYEFVYEGQTILSAYVGNFPQDHHANTEKGTINGLMSESFVTKDSNGSEKNEVLIKFSDRRNWPSYIHFWYPSNLRPQLKSVVEQIIVSIKEI